MGDSGGAASPAGASAASATAYRTFRQLVESADKKFARVRDLPPYDRGGGGGGAGGASPHHIHAYEHCYRKAFKAYTRVWRFQQEHRTELLATGLQRWEIGEAASRIGQLYYGQYQRTSELRFLVGAYVFYEAIWIRGYFEKGGKGKGVLAGEYDGELMMRAPRRQQQQKGADLAVRAKEFRFYARFFVVALLLDRVEVVKQLVEKFRGLLGDCRVSFPGTDFKEWRRVLLEIVQFVKADSGFPTTRSLRYSLSLDCHSLSQPHISRFHPPRALKLQEVLLASYRRSEVKFAELTLDTFRMLQSFEWEPNGFFCQKGPVESKSNGGYNDQSGPSGLIDINLAGNMVDSDLPPNSYKAILYHPSVSQLIAVIATICERLAADTIFLVYLSASGSYGRNIANQKEDSGGSRNRRSNSPDDIINQHDTASSRQTFTLSDGIHDDDHGNHLYFGSGTSKGLNKLYPADLIPFTRRPLFLIIDSDRSNAFKVIHGSERGEIAALLLSPLKPIFEGQFASDANSCGSQFTFFLTMPLQAFCQLAQLGSDVDHDTCSNADSVLSSVLSKWEILLCTSGSLNTVWAQTYSDPFLRRIILRFIFCRGVLHMFNHPEKGNDHLPQCLPELPDCVSPDSSTVQSGIILLAETLGVANQFSSRSGITS